MTRLKLAVIVTSDRLHEKKLRGEDVEDVSGDVASKLILKAGHVVERRVVVPNDPLALLREVVDAVKAGVDAVLVSGGTGLGPRDVAVEALTPLFDKHIPGFGELFRRLSFDAVGSAAMLSRADAGLYQGTAIFIVPGSPQAVELALSRLILPELGHLLAEARGLRRGAEGGS